MSDFIEITDEELKELQEKFKAGFKGHYIPDLVTAMNKRKTELGATDDYNPRYIYNIFNGGVKSQFVRKALLDEGNKLLKHYQNIISGNTEEENTLSETKEER